MKQDFDEMHYFAGYPGNDSMREKAKRLMLEEMMGTQMNMPGSMSEPGREKMRMYKKGGHVHKHHKHHSHHSHEHAMHKIKGGLVHEPHSYEHEAIHPYHGQEDRHHESTHAHRHGYHSGGPAHERGPGYKKGGHAHHKHHAHHEHHDHESAKERKRAHLHHMQREGLHETERALAKEKKLSHGGHAHERGPGYKKGGHHHMHDGGQPNLLPMHRHEESGMKRLGNGHHHETRQHETYRNKYTPKNIEGGSLTNLHVPTPKLNVESIKGAEMMHKGGHMHRHTHKKHHHPVKKAAGGTVYEREMRGVHPASHLSKINYEKDMKGVKPSHIPHMTGTTRKNPGALDESFGSVFKRGGKACAGGKAKKFAAGGAGKVRHGVADKFGRPNMKKMKMGY